eukprot:TRINITY_DN10172_c0_g1_i1.p1 TRINITY_DN10172_c0_g1~~TRINITY_DN10172_c0_g1_i1.p1  ORF type:complete len:469 (+),score=56.86 TRINITY_DN10172_c0_g1_i1:119-1525(+)
MYKYTISSDPDDHTFDPLFNHITLSRVLIYATLAEIAGNLGYMWWLQPNRILPFWALKPIKFWSNYLQGNRLLNNALVVLLMLLLGFALILPDVKGPMIIGWGLLLVLGVGDLWRFVCNHYWIVSLAGVAFEFEGWLSAVRIIFASIYFWSGFLKLFSWDFYEGTAPVVFRPMHLPLIYLSRKLDLSQDTEFRLNLIVSILGVFTEMLMGIVFFIAQHIPPLVVYVFLVFNIFMHTFILVYIGWNNNIMVFWSWNIMCIAVSQYCFSPSFALYTDIASSNSSYFILFCIGLFTIFPVSVFFGMCPNGCLSHSYFAPGWDGDSNLLVPVKNAKKLPRVINGSKLNVYYVYPEGVQMNLLLSEINIEDLQKMAGFDDQVKHDEAQLREFLSKYLCAMDGSIVDFTFQLWPKDPWKTFYLPGPNHFWQDLVDDVIDASCIHIRTRHWKGLHYVNEVSLLVPKTLKIENIDE